MSLAISTICSCVKDFEHDDLIDTVQELGPEQLLHLAHDAGLDLLVGKAGLALGAEAERGGRGDLAGAHVGRHDDDRVAEIDRATLGVGQTTFLEDLQQDVEHIGMRLLDFVEQHDRIRTLANGFGKLAAFVEAHIARRRTDQAAHAVLLHVFRHVIRDKRVFGAEQKLSERLGRLGFAHARSRGK
mgnify:CR=1 FL=1